MKLNRASGFNYHHTNTALDGIYIIYIKDFNFVCQIISISMKKIINPGDKNVYQYKFMVT